MEGEDLMRCSRHPSSSIRFVLGWNDPPKNVGEPTGNLKISLNKRVAFPLSSAPPPTNASASPLLLPPKPPITDCGAIDLTTSKKNSDELSSDDDVNSQKVKVLSVLTAGVDELSTSVQSAVATKLKLLEDDWNQCDLEVRKLLIELANCKFSLLCWKLCENLQI